MAGENTHILPRIEGGFISINFGGDRAFRFVLERIFGGRARRGLGLRGRRRFGGLRCGGNDLILGKGSHRQATDCECEQLHGCFCGDGCGDCCGLSFDWSVITILALPVMVPCRAAVSNLTVSPTISKSARLIVVRCGELRTRVFKSSTESAIAIWRSILLSSV